MEATILSLPDLTNLRDHVRRTLCSCDQLDPGQTPMREDVLKRAGKPCGMTFQVEGPRMLRIYAVWAAQERRILFYDSTGNRFAETKLAKSPDVTRLGA
jgi:hypothetical protein